MVEHSTSMCEALALLPNSGEEISVYLDLTAVRRAFIPIHRITNIIIFKYESLIFYHNFSIFYPHKK